ncbi:MG2 domain-containing protein [Hymenobacter nivis]|uniref:TonB-dependent receptor plug domain-containing protein n=1 Tax=Hymenobacter nivis TaxID=1850093 RepID=A0A502H008_9BACT|nr:MG2 domain-containing protein [Hymenobacter nivis]TPG67002.1 hypothetical protein EAH73_04475 [Hymenobacter nivis]
MFPSTFRRRLAGAVAAAGALAAAAFQLPAADASFPHIVKSLAEFYGTSLPEKAYLHLDRPFYAAGETVWFKAYLAEADSHRPDTLSKVLYVDLLSARGGLVAKRTLRLRGGLAPGDLALPDTLPAGTYQLRAYTSWMRNAGAAFFFARPLVVTTTAGAPAADAGAPGPKIDVQFFPEGGNLVDGLASEVGFRAVDGRGRGVAVQGTVRDGQGRPVASFGSRHLGMGAFHFAPAPGQRYRAVVALPGGGQAEYPLPASQPTGYAIGVSETADDFVVVIRRRLAAGEDAGGPALLLAQVRGHVAYAAQAPVGGAAPVVAKLPKAKFAPGLAHITLFDAQGTAQCERLVLVPNPPGVRLVLTPDRPAYAPRTAVRLRLAATDAAGQPVAGEFSVAVAAGPAGPEGPSIVSHLLLTSDLAGPVEDPGYYFREPQTADTRQALNNLLLTQGWRRFVWKELLAGQRPGREFALEQGLGVRGQLLAATGQPAAARAVDYLQTNPTRQAQTQTDASGHFQFRGLGGLDTAHVLLRAPVAKGERPYTLRLLAPPPAGAPLPTAPLAAQLPPGALADYARRAQQQRALALRAPIAAGQPVALDAVRVRGQRAPADGAARPYSNRNAVVLRVGDLARNAESRTLIQYLQGRVAGVAVSGQSINIRQSATLQDQSTGGFGLVQPLFLIDGAIVPADFFASYPLRDVETIDVLNQSAAAMFGSQAYGGVIAAYTRQAAPPLDADPQVQFAAARAGVLSAQVPGYYRAREFYAPRYEAPSAQPDPRYTTLYWAPAVRTDASGQAQLSFFTADASGPFQIVAEGLSAQGTPMRGSAVLVVQGAPGK